MVTAVDGGGSTVGDGDSGGPLEGRGARGDQLGAPRLRGVAISEGDEIEEDVGLTDVEEDDRVPGYDD
ncbi:hypothetical protein R6Q59_006320 [Mikania micrantha]